MEIGEENKKQIEQTLRVSYQENKTRFKDHLALIEAWFSEPRLPQKDQSWRLEIGEKLKSAMNSPHQPFGLGAV
jgi:hypothetical protein